jgi:MFS family permease
MRTGVLAAASIAVATSAAALYSGPVFRAALVADLGWSNELAAGAFAVGYLAAGATPILSGMVADRFGASRLLVAGLLMAVLGLGAASITSVPWHWYLAAGIGLSVAYYLVHIGSTLIATQGAARGTAVGVAIGLGVGVGLAAGPVMSQGAIDLIGWRDTLSLFAAGVLAIALGLHWWLRRSQASTAPTSATAATTTTTGLEHQPTDLLPGGHSRRRLLIGFFLGNLLLAVFDEAVYQHGYTLAVARGLSSQEAAWLLGIVSLALTVGMLLGGPLSDLIGRRSVLIGAALLVLVMLLGITHAAGSAIWLWGAGYGLGLGASIAVRSAAWGDAFAGPGRGRAFGIVATGYPVGAAATIWLGAAWIDLGGSYEALYLVAASAAGLWALLGGWLTRQSPAAAAAQARPAVARPQVAAA